MDAVTNIIMDEDDAFAIITRELISEHPFFQWTGKQRQSPRVKMSKGKNLRSTDSFFTSLETLYDVNIRLLTTPNRATSGWDDDGADEKSFVRFRPEDELIDALFEELKKYWDGLIDVIPDLSRTPSEMRDHSAADDSTTQDSLLFWPIGQQLLGELARDLLNHRQPKPNKPTVESVMKALQPLGQVEWSMHSAPWRHVLLIPDNKDMTSWKIRNEDRREAQQLCKRIVKWQIGLDRLDTDEVDELREEWEQILLPALDSEVIDQLWTDIEDGAQR